MLGLPVTQGTHKSQPILSISSTNNEESKEIKFQASAEDTPSVSPPLYFSSALPNKPLMQRGVEGC